MTQGIYIQDDETSRFRRPKSKKEIRETLAISPALVHAQATSWHGNEYDGSIASAPEGLTIVFTGPDPERDRRFYGTIAFVKGAWKVS